MKKIRSLIKRFKNWLCNKQIHNWDKESTELVDKWRNEFGGYTYQYTQKCINCNRESDVLISTDIFGKITQETIDIR